MKKMTRSFCARMAVALGLSIVSLLAQDKAEKKEEAPRVLFRLSFDNGLVADEAAGSAAHTNAGSLPELVDGIKGKAAFFGPNQYLRFLEKGNLDKQSGSLSVWVQAPADGTGVDGERYTVFVEDGPNKVGSTILWAWLHGGQNLRFDVRDAKDQYSYFIGPSRWVKGQWHQIVYTWDAKDRVQVYVDARRVVDRILGKWTPKPYEAFFVGAMNASGNHPWGAAIDEVVIYDRPLTLEEVRAEFLKVGKLYASLTLHDPFYTAGKEAPLRVEMANESDQSTQLSDIKFEVHSADGKVVQKGAFPNQTVKGLERLLASQSLKLDQPGTYAFTMTYNEQGSARRYDDVLTVLPAREKLSLEPTKETLVTEVDVTKREPLANDGGTTVVSSAAGEYREAGSKMHSRFAVDFAIKDVRAPHLAVITYPDDKPRTMEIILQDLSGKKDYQAQSGVFAGDEYPLSGKMQETRIYFWPHSERQSFIFMTAERGHPAAVKDIKVYRLDRLAPAPEPGQFTGSVPKRRVGLYYEDCVLNQVFGTSPDLEGFTKATDMQLDYMQMSGQTELCYPVAWYNGPLYGTLVESSQPDIGGGIGGNRPHPGGFPALYLKKLDARGMKFNAGAHIHWLPSLNPYTITDQERVNKGEETVVNVRGDGKLWHGHWHGSDPNYNPADPRVLSAVKAVINEITERYGQEPAFNGITLVLARNKLFTFGSIESGYNDVNLQSFQKESGVKIPVYAADKPTRFAESYKWLMANPEAKKAWIDWRCKKLHDHYKQMADEMTKRRPDLKLTLNIFTARAFYNRLSSHLNEPGLEVMRETGIDPRLYANDANIILSYTLVPAELRWRRSLGDGSPSVEGDTFRGVDNNRTVMMAPEIAESFGLLPQTSVILHDRYWEDPIAASKPLKDLGIKECTWRVSTLNAPYYHSLEPYVAALNNFDALTISKGGFLIGTFGMEKDLLPFSQALGALPAVRFDDVDGVSDPVRIRQKVVDGKLYFYVLNRLPEPVEIKVALKESKPLDEPVTGKTLPAAKEVALKLEPYGLRVFRADGGTQRVTGGDVTVDAVWLKALEASLDKAQKKADAKRASAPEVAKIAPYLEYAQKCWKQKAYARVYFLMQEAWAADLEKL